MFPFIAGDDSYIRQDRGQFLLQLLLLMDLFFSTSFPSRRCGHSLCGRCVRHLQCWPSGLLWGGSGPACGWRRQADGWDGEEAWEGRVHRWHDPRPEVKWTDTQWLNNCLFFFYIIKKWTGLSIQGHSTFLSSFLLTSVNFIIFSFLLCLWFFFLIFCHFNPHSSHFLCNILGSNHA